MRRHELTSELGEESPLSALEEVDGHTLLLGVGYDRCTALHLAEYRLPGLRRRENACVVTTPKGRRWVTYNGAALDAGSFAELGEAYEATAGAVVVGVVGAATSRLLRIRDAVGFAVDWLRAYRQP
jgi:aminoglycoside 3-N-acetyltransferase